MIDDSALTATAQAQYGYFTAQQAISAGYAKALHQYHVKSGDWLKVDRALFRFPGYPDTIESKFVRWSLWAEKKHGGRKVTISHQSALKYYELCQISDTEPVHLTVPLLRQPREEKQGCIFHRVDLPEDEIYQKTGFQITTEFRTLIDMKPDLILSRQWGQAVRAAQETSLIDQAAADELLAGISNAAMPLQGLSVRRIAMPRELFSPPRQSNLSADNPDSPLSPLPAYHADQGRRLFGSRSAFTLVELLVVISIISILASLLMPALAKARDAAYSTQCFSNVRNINGALTLYSNDYDGYFPAGYSGSINSDLWWYNQVGDYLQSDPTKEKSIFKCPVGRDTSWIMWGYGHYAYAEYFSWNNDILVSIRPQYVRKASRWLTIAESGYYQAYDALCSRITPHLDNIVGFWHRDMSSNAAYLDGHVAPQLLYNRSSSNTNSARLLHENCAAYYSSEL